MRRVARALDARGKVEIASGPGKAGVGRERVGNESGYESLHLIAGIERTNCAFGEAGILRE
jgi:hypothetical protein